jgi:hypothetical protein
MMVHSSDDGKRVFLVTDCKHDRAGSIEYINDFNAANSDVEIRFATEDEYKFLLSINVIIRFGQFWLNTTSVQDGKVSYDESPASRMKLLIVKELKDTNMNDRYKITNGSIIITKPKRIDLTIDEAKELLEVLPVVIEEYENDYKQVRMASIVETIKGLHQYIEQLKEELDSLR